MNANRQNLANSLRGPLILITIGVLFLLDKVSGLGFDRTWPILLIMLGVLALVGGTRRMAVGARTSTPIPEAYMPPTPQQVPYPPPPSAYPAPPPAYRPPVTDAYEPPPPAPGVRR